MKIVEMIHINNFLNVNNVNNLMYEVLLHIM